MARQPKKPVVTTKACPSCGNVSLHRERRPGKWIWRCQTPKCEFKREGKS